MMTFSIEFLNLLFFVSFFQFFLGALAAMLTNRNILIIMIAIELMFLSVAFSFAVASVYLDDVIGEIFFLFLISLAGAEASIGLSILIIYYRLRGIISLKTLPALKG